MTDITHDNIFTNDVAPRLRRILDEEIVAPRATDHEVAPFVPPPAKSPSDEIADKLIADADRTVTLVMQRYQELRDQISEGEQLTLQSQVDYRETIRNHMRIIDATMKAQDEMKQHIAEAQKLLRPRNEK